LDEILEGEVSFFPGVELETQHAYNTYAHRYRLQRDVLDDKNKVKGYEYVLDKLKSENEGSVLSLTITSEKSLYVLFTTCNLERLMGILYSEPGNLERAKELRKEYQDKGLDVSSKLFYKGFIRN